MPNSPDKLPEDLVAEARMVAKQVTLTKEQRAKWSSWIDNLRSGNYQQTSDCLRDESGYCCLGVLLVGDRPEIEGIEIHYYDDQILTEDLSWEDCEHTILLPRLRSHYGLDQRIGVLETHLIRGGKAIAGMSLHDMCTALNDEYQLSFPQIAEFLEIILNGAKHAKV